MKMKRLAALCAVVWVLFALSAEGAAIRVGEISTLTGDYEAYGAAEAVAVAMAVEEINAAGGVLGRPLELVLYDCRTLQEEAVNTARRLTAEDKVTAVIGPSGSGLCIAAAPVFAEERIPHIATLPTNPLVTVDEDGKVRPYSFRISFLDPYQGRVMAWFAAKEMDFKKAAILSEAQSEYSRDLRGFFIEHFKKYGGTIVAVEGFDSGASDFRAQLAAIEESEPDVLIYPFMGRALPLAVRQAREMGLTMPIVGGDGYGNFMWETAGTALGNTYWVSHIDRYDPTLKPFFDKYEARTGAECQEFMNAVAAYDCVYWLKDAIERAGTDDPAKVRDALEATKGLKLTHAVLTMDDFHNPKDKDAVILSCDPVQKKALFFKRLRPEGALLAP